MTDFRLLAIGRYKAGAFIPPRKEGQVDIHDGDVTTVRYNLSGLAGDVEGDFRKWAAVAFIDEAQLDAQGDEYEIAGDWPDLQVSKV